MPVFDTTPPGMGGRTGPQLALRSGNLTPPRISPSCPHCLRLWLDSEYRADGVIAKQLAMAAFGWVGTAGHLPLWPSLIAEMEFTAIHLPLQVVLAHPPHRLSHSSWGRQPTLLVAGYDRSGRCFSRFSKRPLQSLHLLGHQNQNFRNLFQKIFNSVKIVRNCLLRTPSNLCNLLLIFPFKYKRC